jgi:hypothetical protein
MAKLPRSGVAYQCLNECECTLPEIMVSLGLKPLSKLAERKLRDRLGFALAQWEEPYTAVEVEDVVSSLNAHAKRLDKLAPLAAVAKGGFCRSEAIAITGQLVKILKEDSTIGNLEAAYSYLRELCDLRRARAANLDITGMTNSPQCWWTFASRTRSSQTLELIAFRENRWAAWPRSRQPLNACYCPKCVHPPRRRW